MNTPQPKSWPCSCHKCGKPFTSPSAIAITCPPCESTSNALRDVFAQFGDLFGGKGKQQ